MKQQEKVDYEARQAEIIKEQDDIIAMKNLQEESVKQYSL